MATRAKNVKQAAMMKRLSRKGGKKRAVRSRLRKGGVLDRDTDRPSSRAVSRWTDRRLIR